MGYYRTRKILSLNRLFYIDAKISIIVYDVKK